MRWVPGEEGNEPSIAAGASSSLRFEALGTEFAEDVTFDNEGLVVDYPRVGKRIV